jgi:hypothetical protein
MRRPLQKHQRPGRESYRVASSKGTRKCDRVALREHDVTRATNCGECWRLSARTSPRRAFARGIALTVAELCGMHKRIDLYVRNPGYKGSADAIRAHDGAH